LVTFTVNANANALSPGTYGPVTITIANTTNGQGNTNLTATLVANPVLYGLIVSVIGSGKVTSNDSAINCPSACDANYTKGTQVTLAATPSSGYGFSGWSGACSGTGSCAVTMNSAMNVSANFVALRDRVFVSSNGNDANPCTFLSPCKTFQQALSVVAPGGEISAVDSAGFGPITITKSVTLTSPNGIEAGIVPTAGGNAVTINAGPSDAILLRGLTINGSGASYNGIIFNSGGSLIVVDCVVQNFVQNGGSPATGNGILIQPTSGTVDFTITNTILANNGFAGILYSVPSGTPNAEGTIDNVVATGNTEGIYFNGPGSATVRNSNATNNIDSGIRIDQGTVAIDNVHASGNAYGIAAKSQVLLGRSVITGNGTGILNNTSNNFHTYADNSINGNTTDISSPLNTLTLQ
jgi:hypothetical protein